MPELVVRSPEHYFCVLPHDVRLYALQFIQTQRGRVVAPNSLCYAGRLGTLFADLVLEAKGGMTSCTCAASGEFILTFMQDTGAIMRFSGDGKDISALTSLTKKTPLMALQTSAGELLGVCYDTKDTAAGNQFWFGHSSVVRPSIALNRTETRLYVCLDRETRIRLFDMPYRGAPPVWHIPVLVHPTAMVVLSDDSVVASSAPVNGMIMHYSLEGRVLEKMCFYETVYRADCLLAVDADDVLFIFCPGRDSIYFSHPPYATAEFSVRCRDSVYMEEAHALAIGHDGAVIVGAQKGQLQRFCAKK